MSDPGWVRIASLKTPAAFRAAPAGLRPRPALRRHPARRRLLAARAAARGRRPARRQPLLHPADGGLGRHAGRRAERADRAPLAPLRRERREADLGRRGGRRAPRRPRQPQPARRPSERHCRRHRAAARGARGRARRAPSAATPPTTSSSACSSRTPAAGARPDALGPPAAARRLPTIRCSTAASPAGDAACSRDDELDGLVDDFVRAARLADRAGFDFVDVKHCHGYLGHELLSRAHARRAATAAASRTARASLRTIVDGHPRRGARPARRRAALGRSTRCRTARTRAAGACPRPTRPATAYAFGAARRRRPRRGPRRDATRSSRCCVALGVAGSASTAGSPYYNPHVQRPALFPPSDGYLPPEDPLVGVARQIEATARLKAAFPDMVVRRRRPTATCRSGCRTWRSAWSRDGLVDVVGLGRMVLCVPGAAGRRARRPPARPQAPLPHVQRLHDGAAQRPGLGLLPARRLLRRAARGGAAEGGEGGAARMSLPPEAADPSPAAPARGSHRRNQALAVATAFLALFSIVGLALYGLPFFYDFFVRDLGWTRQQVTSGNALQQADRRSAVRRSSPAWVVDRFGPRRLMLAGIVMAGARARRPRQHLDPRRVLRLLPPQRARLRVRRAAAEPGAALALVRGRRGQGDGLRVPRHRHRRRARAAARLRAHPGARLAGGARRSSAC